jgi:hypothetical protein
MPVTPPATPTKIVPGLVGWTTILLIDRPEKAPVFPVTPLFAVIGLIGPLRVAVVLAALMRYSPTPLKLSPLPFASPVPTYRMEGSDGANASAPPEASALTDANGVAVLDLSAGPHWVFVQRTDPPGFGPLGASIMRAMPDGTLTPMWAEVDLTDGNPAAVTLSGVRLNP